jgi:hypothetical protein
MKRRPTKRSPEGQAAYERFKKRWAGKPCWGCGQKCWPFHRHHIVNRAGKIYDDERNLAHLCDGCHSAHHDGGIETYMGRIICVLTDIDILRLKRDHDPDHWDLEFLRLLAGPGDGRLNMAFGEGME